jgi:AcrR family transcriptional regulator
MASIASAATDDTASDTRTRIEEALLALTAEGERLNHDIVAERAGVSRRTVYRYFPDRDALMRAMWARLSPATAPNDKMPHSVETLLDQLDILYEGFDQNAAAMTVVMASAEGRAMRNTMTPQRVAGYRKALGDVTAHLPEPAATEAIAAIQLLRSGFAWREMRDQWDMDGQQIASSVRWAIEVLIAELKRGGGPGTDSPTD